MPVAAFSGPQVGDGQPDQSVAQRDTSVAGVEHDSDEEVATEPVEPVAKIGHRGGIADTWDR